MNRRYIEHGKCEYESTDESFTYIDADNDYGDDYYRAEAESWDMPWWVYLSVSLIAIGVIGLKVMS